MVARISFLFAVALALGSGGCGSTVTPPPTPPPCDEKCKDGIAIKALRETTKLAFNLTLQGKEVGAHDLTTPCPFGGGARVFGTAASNALQGTMEVKLTYVLAECEYMFQDDDADDNYVMTLSGVMTQEGIIAVQPSSTSALIMKSETMRFSGTVYDPPLEYAAECPVELGQNGNNLTGRICGRTVTADL